MISPFSPTERLQLDRAVARIAIQDPVFRSALLEDPKSTIEREILGWSLRPETEVVVLSETSNKIYVLLPEDQQADDDGELCDEQLAWVAGGKGGGMGQVFCVVPAAKGAMISKNEINLL